MSANSASNSQTVASASFTVEASSWSYAMTLSAFAWNIVRTYTLTPETLLLRLLKGTQTN